MSMNIQIGHIARHTPRGAGAQGREAAVVDVEGLKAEQRYIEKALAL